ncbi:MAG TPA: GNAT family N-acetyltransferase [Acidobacteriaceae bacterium]|jgi:RimJ/RimL family protein N-acetyltransferase
MQTRRAPSREQLIETPRLLLITVTEEMLRADQKNEGLGALLGAIVPSTWPPEYWDQRAIDYLYERIHRHPHYRGWCRYVALKQPASALPVLIGGCGCTEPPEMLEEVEIGYSILKEFRRHGYITEAINGLVPWIFTYSNVQSVCAQTYPHLAASIGVLRKCGFVLDGSGKDPGTVLFRRKRG